MSIPKEPRQLMINIMYLVLTALLALNVSAEVFNAFKLVDKGLVKSNQSLDEANNNLPQLIRDGAKKKASLATYAERIDPIRSASSSLTDYLQGVVDGMIKEGGGYLADRETGAITDELKAAKDYDITTRTLVSPADPKRKAQGPEVKARLLAYKDEILKYIDEEDRVSFTKNISVQVDDETWKKKGKKSWSQMNFDHMPLQAVIPIFSKYINDVKSTEAAALNYLANEVGTTTDVVLDKFTVVSAPEKSYIIKGEKFKSDLFLSAFAGADSKTGISISVNGRNLPTNKEGIATFEETANTVGVKKFNASASIKNPVTGEVQTFKKEFSYEVGERSVAISPTKMNVFYIGVDNPVEVSAAGVPSSQIKVSMGGAGGGTINRNGDGTYNVKVTKPTVKGTFAKVNVSAPGMNASKDFRVKRIPDPIPVLGKSKGGGVKSGIFKSSPGIYPLLEGFDFDAKCNIVDMLVVRAEKRKDPKFAKNPGSGKWGPQAAQLVQDAKPGDRYFIEGIKCKCPGDKAPRDLGSMSFSIR